MLALYGYSREQLSEMTVLDIRPSYERGRMQAAVNVRSDMERSGRWVHLKANGETFEVRPMPLDPFQRRRRHPGGRPDRTEFNEAQRRLDEAQTILTPSSKTCRTASL